MKKLIIVGMLALSLTGCESLSRFEQAVSIVAKSATNPVTTKDLYEIESAISIGLTALQTYKRGCEQRLVDTNCAANVATVQQYTRQMLPYLKQLRSFVKDNDQINAVVAYNQLSTLYQNAKQTATNLGIKFGG